MRRRMDFAGRYMQAVVNFRVGAVRYKVVEGR